MVASLLTDVTTATRILAQSYTIFLYLKKHYMQFICRSGGRGEKDKEEKAIQERKKGPCKQV